MKTTDAKIFGKTSTGEKIQLYTLCASCGIEIDIIDYGGAIQSLRVPDRDGHMRDIVLGYDTAEDYERQNNFFGALIGRYANRIGRGRFTLDGEVYQLACNDGKNHLHGGVNGFDKKIWETHESEDSKLILTYTSADGEENYPGKLKVSVIYSLDESGALRIEYTARSDKTTLFNPTNHSYFNLDGHNSGNVFEQMVRIDSNLFTPTDEDLIPNGTLLSVENTPLDFRTLTRIGKNIAADYSQIAAAGGFDHNYAFQEHGKLREVAYAVSDKSGIDLTVSTDLPGLQFYSGNNIDGTILGKGGTQYAKHSAFCFETQYYPDSINHASFPQAILKAGQIFNSVTVYKFGVESK